MVRMRTRFTAAQVLIAGLLILIGLAPAQMVSYGQSPKRTPATPTAQPAANWSEPHVFERNGWFPDIAADASGRVYVAWANSMINVTQGENPLREGYDVVLFTSSADGKSWEPINEIAADRQTVATNSNVTRPSLLAGPDGILHMTFRGTYVYYLQAPGQLSSSARAWTPRLNLAANNPDYYSRLAMDSKGRIHVVYSQVTPTTECASCYHLYHKYSDDQGKNWSVEQDVSVLPTGAAKPQLLVDEQDNVYLTWEAGIGGDLGQVLDPTRVYYAVSYNRGESWSQPVQIGTAEGERSKSATIGRDGHGNVVAAWLSLPEDQIFYQVSSDHGLSWSKPERLPGVWGGYKVYQSRLDLFSTATDSAGNLHLALVGRLSDADEKLSVLHVMWDGSQWSKPEAVVSYEGDAPEWPRLAVSEGNVLNLAWFVRGKDYIWTATGDLYQVSYSRSQVNAPAIAPEAWPTFQLATEVPPTAEPTMALSTLLPTVPAVNATLDPRAQDASSYTESGQLSIIALSAVPALALVAILLAVILIKKR